jgi:cytochrome c
LLEEKMRIVFLLTSIFLLSLAIGCSHQTQPTQSSQQGNQAQPPSHSIPATSERGTPAEARAMLQKAVEHYESDGRSQALADFTGRKPTFIDRDLFVFCIGSNSSTLTAHGAFPQYVGRSVDVWKDADGKPLGKAIQDAASKSDEGSIQYRMINPISGRIEPKITFWKKLSEDVCGVGAYSP